MKELLDAIDAAIVNAEPHASTVEDYFVIRKTEWEAVCVARSKLEPDAEETKRCDVFDDVRKFLEIGNSHILSKMVGMPYNTTAAFVQRLVIEKYNELREALRYNNLVEVADGAADLIWVVIQLAFAYGIPVERVWNEVARTNMAKFPGGVVTRRADGKICKPEGWEPPRIAEILGIAPTPSET